MELPPKTIVAAGPVIVENDKILLNRERKRDGTESPYFMLPGGRIESLDEPFEETCRREAKEELGIDIKIIGSLRTIAVERPGKPGEYAILITFLAERIGEVVPGEVTVEWGWYDIYNLPENCAPNIPIMVQDYISQKERYDF